jgi:hypothetical protein
MKSILLVAVLDGALFGLIFWSWIAFGIAFAGAIMVMTFFKGASINTECRG